MSDKTEPPTHRRLEEAREEGQVARSLELNTAVVILASAYLLRGQGGALVDLLKQLMVASITMLPGLDVNGPWLRQFAYSQVMLFGPKVGIILLGILACGVVVTLAQTNFLWASKKIGFDFKRLNPIDGFKRIFSSQGLIEFGRALIKLLVIGYVVYTYLRDQSSAILETGMIDLSSGIERWVEMAINMIIRVGSYYMILAIADYAFTRWRFMRQLRMTKDEIKEEYKRSEGDPFLRGRIRAQQRKIARNRMMSNVHKAKVVITNPTHFAVALDYDAGSMRAPRVLAKGAFHVAQRIVDLARSNNIPVVQNVPLARALYKAVEVDQEIPPEMYLAVAEVLAYVYKIRQPAVLQPVSQNQ
jgi:flagellar biosynthetic protein FlhB